MPSPSNTTPPQAVLLCAGKSSRFHPFSGSTHKSMFRIAGKPILHYTIADVQKLGIKDFIIVLGPKEAGSHDIAEYFGTGRHLGITIRYVYERQQLGSGKALLAAAPLIDRPFFLLNPNHINAGASAGPMLERFRQSRTPLGGVIAVRESDNPRLYAVISHDAKGHITSIVEKPQDKELVSNSVTTGIYLLTPDFIPYLERHPVHDYLLITAFMDYLKNRPLLALSTDAPSFSLKYPWHIFPIKEHILRNQSSRVASGVRIASTAVLGDNVVIEEGAVIDHHSVIKDNVYIGNNVHIGAHNLVRRFSCFEPDSRTGCHAEVKNTLFGADTTMHTGYIGDSLLGEHCRIGADFLTANKRIDRQDVHTFVKGEKVNTKREALGTMMGDNCKVGIRTSTMPGVIISPHTNIPPGSMIMKNQ